MASVVAGMVAATLEEGVAAVEADAAASCNTYFAPLKRRQC